MSPPGIPARQTLCTLLVVAYSKGVVWRAFPQLATPGVCSERTRNSGECVGITAHAAMVLTESMPLNAAGGNDAHVAALGPSCLRRGKGVRGRSRVCDPPRAFLCAESRRAGAAYLRPDHEISHLPPPAQAHPPGPQGERTARHTGAAAVAVASTPAHRCAQGQRSKLILTACRLNLLPRYSTTPMS